MWCHVLCFFFQAEDGIRDFHVTGVQTCALPISLSTVAWLAFCMREMTAWLCCTSICPRSMGTKTMLACQRSTIKSAALASRDRKSTRLNSSHVKISYAVFCLKKKKKTTKATCEQ